MKTHSRLKDKIKILKFFSAGIVILMVLPLIMLPVFFVCPSTIYAQESDDIIIKEINFYLHLKRKLLLKKSIEEIIRLKCQRMLNY